MTETTRRLSLYAREHQERLRRWVGRRLRDDVAAEDIAQETWLRAAPVLASGAVANVDGYLMRVASNLIVDRVREERKWGEFIIPDAANADAEAPGPNAEALLIERDRLQHLGGWLMNCRHDAVKYSCFANPKACPAGTSPRGWASAETWWTSI